MVIIFCGIPGSGKSTIAGMLLQRLTAQGRVRVFSSDNTKGPVYRKFIKAVTSTRNGEDFMIFDATFYKKEWRRQIRAAAQDEKVLTVYLHCPLEVALSRNRERRPNISEKAVHIVFHRMEPPKKPSLTIDTATTTADVAAEMILKLVKSQS